MNHKPKVEEQNFLFTQTDLFSMRENYATDLCATVTEGSGELFSVTQLP